MAHFKRIRRSTGALVAVAVGLSVATAHAEDFVLGSHVPLTGNLARVGTGMHEGILVALSRANERYAGEHTFTLETIDDETSPAKAVAAVEKLASEGVVALTGGYGSNIIGPASEAAAKAELVYITSGGVAPELTQRDMDTFFRINNSAGYGKAMVGIFDAMGVEKVSVLFSNKEATTALAHYVEDKLTDLNVTVVMHEFDGSTSDFKPLMNRVKLRDRPDAVAMIGYENDYVGILRAGTVLKPDVKAMVGVWSLATSQMNQEFHDLVQNVYGTSLLPYPVSFQSEEAKSFAAAYNDMFDKEPDYLGQFGYVQTTLLIEAIVRAAADGTIESGEIAKELRATDTDTLIGGVRFDENGDNSNFSHRMGQHQGDRVEIVWPDSAATAEMNFPSTPW